MKNIHLIFLMLLLLSCKNSIENNTYIYKSRVGDYIIEIPYELQFNMGSITNYNSYGKQITKSFKLFGAYKLENTLEIDVDYDIDSIGHSPDGKYDILFNWRLTGCGVAPDAQITLKKDIVVKENEEKFIVATVYGRNINKFDPEIDENYKRLISHITFRFNDILFHLRIKIFEGDKTYIEILKDVELINRIKIRKL